MKTRKISKHNQTGKNNNNFKHGKSFKKSFCIDCGKQLSKHSYYYKAQRCKQCAYLWKIKTGILKGKNNPMFGKHHTEKTKALISKTKLKRGDSKGKKNPMFGKKARHGKRRWYKNICFRSSYEIKFAYFLDLSEYKWKYESKRFYFKDCSYTPDFYVPEWNCYIEIKGYWRDNTKKRFKLFKEKYPKENIKVLMKSELSELGVL